MNLRVEWPDFSCLNKWKYGQIEIWRSAELQLDKNIETFGLNRGFACIWFYCWARDDKGFFLVHNFSGFHIWSCWSSGAKNRYNTNPLGPKS